MLCLLTREGVGASHVCVVKHFELHLFHEQTQIQCIIVIIIILVKPAAGMKTGRYMWIIFIVLVSSHDIKAVMTLS